MSLTTLKTMAFTSKTLQSSTVGQKTGAKFLSVLGFDLAPHPHALTHTLTDRPIHTAIKYKDILSEVDPY